MPTLTQSVTLPTRLTSWSGNAVLNQVDPALGIQSLTLSLTGQVVSVVDVTNYDLTPAAFDGVTTGLVTLFRPNGSPLLQVVPVATLQGILPQVASAVRLSANGTATDSLGYGTGQPSSADAALLIGTGQLTLPVAASARIKATGPGSMTARFTSLAGADVSLTAATLPASGPTGGVIYTLGIPPVPPPVFPVGNTKSQTLVTADAAIGAASTLAFDGFDPSLGVLDGVLVSVAADASGSVRLENLDPVAGTATVGQVAAVTLTGPGGMALVSSTVSFSGTRQLAAFDGTDDFAGASGAAITGSLPAGTAGSAAVTSAPTSAFRSGPVALGVTRAGSTTLDAPGNLDIATTLQAGATVTLTYHYVAPTISYTNTATGISGTATSDIYAGPVAGLQRQYIWAGTDGAAISTDAPDVFLHGGTGADALAVSRGSNVLDGGAGSNFLTGGTGADGGHDTFFVDARGGATTWSTLVNFHAGDTATIFGFHAGLSTRPYTASDGTAGYTGLTIHAETKGAGTGADASLTFAGLTQATADAHWTITAGTLSPGTAAATDYLLIQWNH